MTSSLRLLSNKVLSRSRIYRILKKNNIKYGLHHVADIVRTIRPIAIGAKMQVNDYCPDIGWKCNMNRQKQDTFATTRILVTCK